MGLRISGTARIVEIDGTPYEPAADIDISEVISAYENTAVDGANFSMRKMVRRNTMRDGVTLLTEASEREALVAISDTAGEAVSIAYINAAGDRYTGAGFININDNTTAENRTNVQLFPTGDWTVVEGQDN